MKGLEDTISYTANEAAVRLWQKHVLPDREIALALGIPSTLWETLKQEGDTPPLFQLGRRLYVRTDDLRSWLDAKAKNGRPGSKLHRTRPKPAGDREAA